MLLAQDDKQHKKRLKEARRTYERSFKAFKQGRMDKDELKEKLRPYKYELKELGYPVKIKDDDRPKEEEKAKIETPGSQQKITVAYKPWAQRSSLTIEEIVRPECMRLSVLHGRDDVLLCGLYMYGTMRALGGRGIVSSFCI